MEWASGNIYIRPTLLTKIGDAVQGHIHNFDHTTLVFSGGVHVKATGPNGEIIERDFYAPLAGAELHAMQGHFLVKKDWKHEITALVDGTVFWCVYSHRDPQGDVVQENNGWHKNYV